MTAPPKHETRPPPRTPRRRLRLGLAVAAAPLALLLLYLLATVAGGLIAINRDRPLVATGINVYILSNGIHTDVVVPVRTDIIDWSRILPGWDLAIALGLHDYLAFGWGDRDFYLNTPSWNDLHLSTALKALTGLDASVLHVEAMPRPLWGPDSRLIVLTPEEYRHLADYLAASFLRDAAGAPVAIADAHYNANDGFFEATGHYSMLFTCNEWTRRALAAAGVRVPAWSPFGQALFFQVPSL